MKNMKTSIARIITLHDMWLKDGDDEFKYQPTLNNMTWDELLDFQAFFADPPNEYDYLEYTFVEGTTNNEIVRRVEMNLLDGLPKKDRIKILVTTKMEIC